MEGGAENWLGILAFPGPSDDLRLVNESFGYLRLLYPHFSDL